MPWFGLDIGGTLSKVVYFDPTDNQASQEYESAHVRKIRHLLLSKTAYGKTGVRDVHLELDNQPINGRRGTIHFIRFPTVSMSGFINLVKCKGLAMSSSTVYATGGGAYLYGPACEELSLKFRKVDEFHSLVAGIQFILQKHPSECYYFESPLESDWRQVTLTEYMNPPYMVVNIGSGVSILAVDENNTFRRVFGSSLGGGTFQGLCTLLTGSERFEDSLELASRGNNLVVDKLVKDIYGGDYKAFNLSGDTVAASFGNMIHADKRSRVTKEDLTKSVLVSITQNIAALAYLCSKVEKMNRLIFVGNFLRINAISMRHIAQALTYWSSGGCKALFMKHEGYFGAVGCLLSMTSKESKEAKVDS